MPANFARFRQFLAIFSVLLTVPCFFPENAVPADKANPETHGPVIAGTWYPANPSELKSQVDKYLQNVPDGSVNGKITAIISPHAGLIYSGQVAAYSYKQVAGRKFDTVIVIAPSHYVAFQGAAVLDCAGFGTPLGAMPLDRALLAELTSRDPHIINRTDAFTKEHSLEIQLPFLQSVLQDAKLVPIVMGEPDIASCRRLADTIAECVKGKSVLIVASSDLSHFHSYDTANRMDARLLDLVRAMDVEGLEKCLDGGQCEACGRGPVLTAVLAAKKLGANRCDVLKYANSGDVTMEKNSPRGVVGYGAAVLYKSPAAEDASSRDKDSAEEKPKRKAGVDLGLTDQEKAELHSIARKTVESRCRGEAAPVLTPTSFAKLNEPRGAFVTLYKNGQLRGCIGHIIARKPLAETVAEMAEAAALHDSRFTPVRPDELGDITIEISVMTPLQKAASPDEVEVGKHGIVISRRGSPGVLLPQVATEYGWDRTQFLENTCKKAGLPRDCWKDKETEIYLFSADVF